MSEESSRLSSAGGEVRVYIRRRTRVLVAIGLPILVAFLVFVLSREYPPGYQGLVLLLLVVIAGAALAWLIVIRGWRDGTPALVIDRRGIRINLLFAPVSWIPRDQVVDLATSRGQYQGMSFSHLTVEVANPQALTDGLSWVKRLVLRLNGGSVIIPTTMLELPPEVIEWLIRSIVMKPVESP